MEASSEGRVRQRLSPGLPRLAITRGARCTESAPGPGCPDCSVSTRPSQCDPKSSALPTCWARASAHCAVPPSPPGYGNSLEPSHRIPFRNSWQGWKWSSFPPPTHTWECIVCGCTRAIRGLFPYPCAQAGPDPHAQPALTPVPSRP